MSLDQTARANHWLCQFPLIDREIAKQLIRSLRLVSLSDFESQVHGLIEGILGETGKENLALFGVPENHRTYENSDPRSSVKTRSGNVVVREPKEQRKAGSSSDRVRHLNESIARVSGPRVRSHPTVASMRAERIRNVILVDDFIGTGGRITSYFRNGLDPSVKSWISFGWTKLWIVAYAALEDGVKAVCGRGYSMSPHRVRLATPSQSKGENFSPLMIELANKYGGTRIPLGVGGGAVAHVFEHGCPNNAPAILWAHGKRTKALFPGRGIPLDLKPAFQEVSENQPSEALWSVAQYRLAISRLTDIRRQKAPLSSWHLLAALGFASRRGWDDKTIARMLGSPTNDIVDLRTSAYRLAILDVQTHRLTEFGRGFLEQVKRAGATKPRKSHKAGRSLDEVYYPVTCGGMAKH